MAAAEPPPATGGMGFLGLLSFRRSPIAVASFDPAQDDELLILDALQAHVADRLAALSAAASSSPGAPLLSLAFLSKLLDAVVSSDAAFRDALAVGPVGAALARAPADRLAADLLDRAVKALDVLNAVSLALASLRGSHRAALTAASCLLLADPMLHRAQLARARRAIARLFPGTAAPTTPSSCSRTARALSFSVSSKNWSSGRHAHAMAAPPPPQGLAPAAGCGLGLALYTMSSVLAFATWALAAAVPCTLATAAVAPPKQAQWAAPMAALQERIAEESRRREKKGSSSGNSSSTLSPSSGLLAEMQAVERAARELSSLLDEIAEEDAAADADADSEPSPSPASVSEDRARDVVERAEALAGACRALEDGLAPLERQVRAVFHRVVASRAEVVRCIEHSARSGAGSASTGAPPTQPHSF
ncbi:protein ROH1A-like [Lolium perenne]|uniref:protein ROH1A-like n=1 Tax=Lolium perenne TaxID=4522 RepID=UPI0021EA3BF7|nr:protein ROH1-like [Lolium perenne]